LFVAEDKVIICWAVGLGIDEVWMFLNPVVARMYPGSITPVTIEHLVERFGLFIIIVLGENIVSGFYEGAEKEFSARIYVSAGIALFISFCMQWIYFDAYVAL
jgi:low temperature requirement protein LtrA